MKDHYDVVVVGGGNAALSAALSARDSGATVAVIECAPIEERGGNSSYTAGAYRIAYKDVSDLKRLMPEITQQEWDNYDFGSYPENEFFDDIARMSHYRTDPNLAEILAAESLDAVMWLQQKGLRFLPYGRHSAKVGEKRKWFGGLVIEAVGGGIGVTDFEYKVAEKSGIDIFYETFARELVRGDRGISGVVVERDSVRKTLRAGAVVLACGGFEANAEWRTRYLGPGWDLAKVRGCRYNQGAGIRMALDAGAHPTGNWSGCHAISWDRNAPTYGDRTLGELFSKHGYPFGIVVNADGKRFMDEGADFYMYTYAKSGRALLAQPGQFAWQLFDAQVRHLIPDDYRIKQSTRVTADSIEELIRKIEDVDKTRLAKTISEFNASVTRAGEFNPTIKDGNCTRGLEIPKSNWALPLEKPPFEAFAVTCGITFTYGGIKINADANVVDIDDRPIPGLYSAGEMVGGIFYFNYPGGSGLTNGTVFGRRAGRSAARFATEQRAS